MTVIQNILISFVADRSRKISDTGIVVHAASSMLNELCEIGKSDKIQAISQEKTRNAFLQATWKNYQLDLINFVKQIDCYYHRYILWCIVVI